MDIQDFWNIYGSGLEPADFVWRFGKGDAEAGVKEYIRTRPAMYGILCHTSWKDTFAAQEQYNRERVAAALLTHLELTRDNWEGQVKGYAAAEAEARQAERKRAEAEALAAAVARVEAEARAKINGETAPPEQPEEPQAAPIAPPALDEAAAAPQPALFDSGLSQVHAQSDAEAIAAAMARVEAEALEKAENPVPEDATGIQPARATLTRLPAQPQKFESAFVPECPPDHGISQARTQADAEAIAAAMARIEAEARKKADSDAPKNDEGSVAQPEPAQNIQETSAGHSVAQPQEQEAHDEDTPPMHSPPGSSPNL